MSGAQEAEVADLDAHLPALPGQGRVGVLGGSFNPPHIAHALCAHAVLLTEPVDEIWVLPCADHPFGKALAPFADRRALCELAFAHLGSVRIVDVEGRLRGPSYTVRTLRALHATRPGIRPRWIVGTDILEELDQWQEPDALQALCELIIVPRAGYPAATRLAFDLPAVSSTEVRARLAAREDVSGLVSRDVLEAIADRGLYR